MLTKMKRLCIIALFAALVMGCANTPKAYPDLKFMSFNIRLGSQWAENEDGPNAWSHRKEAVVAMILKEAPDAIGMQEVLPHQFLYLDSALAGMYKGIGVGRDNGLPATDTACEGEIMCIFYRTDRLELLNQHTYWLSESPDSVSFGWDAACRRTVTMGLFHDLTTDSSFTYLNTHLDHVGPAARRNSILELCTLSDTYPGRIILGGDMNSTLEDSIFLPLTAANRQRHHLQCLWQSRGQTNRPLLRPRMVEGAALPHPRRRLRCALYFRPLSHYNNPQILIRP